MIPAKELGAQALALRESDITLNLDKSVSIPRQRGAAIWQFPGNETRRHLMQEMSKKDIPVFTETDDNYTVPTPGTPGFQSDWQTKQHPGQPENTNRITHRKAVQESDGLIVSTPYLAEVYSHLNPNIHVCRNSIDAEDWPEPSKLDDDVIRVGYAFSTSHYYDFDLILDLLEWVAKQPNVEVVLMGQPMAFAAFKRFPFVNIPWVDTHSAYREMLGVIDVGLAPVRSHRWSDARSDLKVLEYAMAGAMSIASPTESYRPWFDQACVFPAKNTAKEWVRAMKLVLESDKQGIRDFAQEAKDHVINERTIKTGVKQWEEAIASV